jgi:hypothetical protein
MLKMTLKKFFESDIDEGNHELYILKQSRRVLYIGISERGVWNRWFGFRGPHIGRNLWGEMFPNSPAGRAVIENFPKSWKWQFELWTVEDCVKFLAIPHNDRFTIHHVERLMIEKLKPSLNVTYANYHADTSDLFDTSDQQKKAHRDLYG